MGVGSTSFSLYDLVFKIVTSCKNVINWYKLKKLILIPETAGDHIEREKIFLTNLQLNIDNKAINSV